MGYNYNYYYYHSSIPYSPKVSYSRFVGSGCRGPKAKEQAFDAAALGRDVERRGPVM